MPALTMMIAPPGWECQPVEPPGLIVVVRTTVSVGFFEKILKSGDVSWYGPRLIRPSVVLVAPEGGVATFSLEICRVIVRFRLEPFAGRSVPPSVNYLVRLQQQFRSDREPQSPGGPGIDDQFERCRLLDGKVAGPRTDIAFQQCQLAIPSVNA
mgnify:CR=1 FL=1